MNRGGSSRLWAVISDVLRQTVNLETAVPEFRAAFDSCGMEPSNLDLGIYGRTAEGEGLFVGLEAKVNERFGNTVSIRYRDAMRRRERGEKTRAPERIKDLGCKFSPGEVGNGFGPVRYQLLTGTAGTQGVGQGISVFHVLVFKTPLYDDARGRENRRDYETFMDRAYGKPLPTNSEGACAHELVFDGKPMICVYQYVDYS